MSTMRSMQNDFRRSELPVTFGLIIALAATYVLAWLTRSTFFAELGFTPHLTRPWGFLTYPFASFGGGGNFIWQLLLLYWLYFIGVRLEKVIGSVRYLIFFFILTLVGAISVFLGDLITNLPVPIFGCLIPVVGLTVAWATRHAETQILCWGLIPVKAKYIGWIYTGVVLFFMGDGAPLIGVFALIPLALSFLFAQERIPGLPFRVGTSLKYSKASERKSKAYFQEVRDREKEREERERLRKLFEGNSEDK